MEVSLQITKKDYNKLKKSKLFVYIEDDIVRVVKEKNKYILYSYDADALAKILYYLA